MFGYVIPYRNELKLKDIKRYKAYYCTICNQLRKRYGRMATAFLSYEMVFTLILLDSFSDMGKNTSVSLSCQFDFLHIGNINVCKDLVSYIAWTNMYLSVWKLKDNWIDDKKIGSYLLYKLISINKNYKSDCVLYSNPAANLEVILNTFYDMERKNECDFDELAQLMGDAWKTVFECGTQFVNISPDMEKELISICEDLAKFLYCIDAYDDYERDLKKGNFNPLQKMPYELDEALSNGFIILKFIIYSLKNKIRQIEFSKCNDILQNIIFFGLEYKLNLIVGKKEKKYGKGFFRK